MSYRIGCPWIAVCVALMVCFAAVGKVIVKYRPGAEYTVWVDRVLDGDTVKVYSKAGTETVRLYGIDAPEKSQRFGGDAARYLSGLVCGKTITLHRVDVDRYGRTIGDLRSADGQRVSVRMVDSGHAWWYRQYAGKDAELRDAETAARSAHVGLWADDNPVAPWLWRARKKQGGAMVVNGCWGYGSLMRCCSIT